MPERFIKIHHKETASEALVEEIAFKMVWKAKGWEEGRLPKDDDSKKKSKKEDE